MTMRNSGVVKEKAWIESPGKFGSSDKNDSAKCISFGTGTLLHDTWPPSSHIKSYSTKATQDRNIPNALIRNDRTTSPHLCSELDGVRDYKISSPDRVSWSPEPTYGMADGQLR